MSAATGNATFHSHASQDAAAARSARTLNFHRWPPNAEGDEARSNPGDLKSEYGPWTTWFASALRHMRSAPAT